MKQIATTLILIALLCGITIASESFAAEDQFIISQQIINAADGEPPSIPQNLVATAVSSSQINLSWDASTDNVGVEGYEVFRDLAFVATTTATSYADSGLLPETLYAYTVRAFDSTPNYSTSSATATATTLPVPPPEPDEPSGGGGSSGLRELKLESLTVSPDLYSAVLHFVTNLDTKAVVSWGITPDYELGTIAGQLYLKSHNVMIDDLTPGTTYYFKIVLTDAYNRVLTLQNQQFTTLSLPDFTPPANVTNLRAVGGEKTITLTWNNPPVDFDSVRIVRSDKFYPKDIYDGKVVYEGSEEIFVDTDVVQDTIYYYTVFAKDKFGNYSSGAVTRARLYKLGQPPLPDDVYAEVEEIPGSQVHPQIRNLTLLDLDFYQNGVKLPIANRTVHIQGDRELRIALEYNKVPEILKTIAITMRDPEDSQKTFSFLLRVNKDKTAYDAIIAPLGRSGDFEFGVAILDHKNQGLKKLAGVIVSTVPELVSDDITLQTIIASIRNNLPTLLLLILIILVGYFGHKIVRSLRKGSDYTY